MGNNLTYLSLFSGAGGGDLAMQHLLGFNCKGYVEYEEYCQKVLKQRQLDGLLSKAPIFGDIRGFVKKYAECYKGMVDLITGGFPCQAWSTAAHGNWTAEHRWTEMLESIGIIQSKYVFAENVDEDAIIQAQSDLTEIGYKTKRLMLSAKQLGSDHIRRRWWLFADSNYKSKLGGEINAKMAIIKKRRESIWKTYPQKSRVDDGMAHRVDRLKAIGNGQVPIVAATAFKLLNGGGYGMGGK